jgi:hypothetical protein
MLTPTRMSGDPAARKSFFSQIKAAGISPANRMAATASLPGDVAPVPRECRAGGQPCGGTVDIA